MTASSTAVRDHRQQARLVGDTLTLSLYVGREKRDSYALSRAAYEAAGQWHGVPGQMVPITAADCPYNPTGARRQLVRAAAWPHLQGEGGDEQAERLVDAQCVAIDAVLRKASS